jgi:CheY-like chemotaxis protein
MKLEQSWEKIILVDDDFVYNLMNQKFLKLIGYPGEILSFTDASEALEEIQTPPFMEAYLKDKKPFLILLDLNMPIFNGWDFLDAFESLPKETKDAFKVVVLTSSINPQDMDKAASYKSVEYFEVKPLKLETIHKLINRLEPRISDLL